jgi:hypothetical protein
VARSRSRIFGEISEYPAPAADASPCLVALRRGQIRRRRARRISRLLTDGDGRAQLLELSAQLLELESIARVVHLSRI